jgi:hypothetical protein
MGIDLLWRGSDGSLRDAAYDVGSTVSKIINGLRDSSKTSLLLTTIDPYGDTRFMTGQAPRLLREFQLIRDETANAEQRIAIGRIISILRASEGASDEWLEFIGD